MNDEATQSILAEHGDGTTEIQGGAGHLNGHLLCAIDTETTGLDYKSHEIWQIACIPLNYNFKAMKGVRPFYLPYIRPENPQAIELDAFKGQAKQELAKAINGGVDMFDAGEEFLSWFERLKLAPGKKIIPLAQNWPFDRDFLREWLMPKSFEHVFHYHYRDLMAAACFINDCYWMRANSPPFGRVGLSNLCEKLGVIYERTFLHNALMDASLTAKCYAALTERIHGV